MADNFGIQPEPFEFEAEDEWNLEAGGAAALQVSARILWPALGFPAVIAPRQNGSTDPLEGNPGRCICVLILSNRKYLSKEDACLLYTSDAADERSSVDL